MMIKFKDICDTFNQIENENSRLSMIEILSNFFIKLKKTNEIGDLIELIQSEDLKLGIGEKTIIKGISLKTGINEEKLKKILIKKGDLGLLAEEVSSIKKQKSILDFTEKEEKKSEYDLKDIYWKIGLIKHTTGAGSLNHRINIISNTLLKLSKTENKYFCRLLNGSIRVGVSDKTIIKSLSKIFKIDEDKIINAYNLFPYLQLIATRLTEKGVEYLDSIKMEYNTPIRMMLASRIEYDQILNEIKNCVAEFKLDGERAQIHKIGKEVTIFSRGLTEITKQYPDIIKEIKKLKCEKCIIEGEIVAMDQFYEKILPFQVLMKRKRKHDIQEIVRKIPVKLFLFDILNIDDKIIIDDTLKERRKILEKIIVKSEKIELVRSENISSNDELISFFNESRRLGNEGIIAKNLEGKYEPNKRGKSWIKMKGLETTKLTETIDTIIIGAYHGRGSKTGLYSTFLCGIINENGDYEEFSRVGSGFSDEKLLELEKILKPYITEKQPNNVLSESKPHVWFTPKIIIEIKGDEITESSKKSKYGLRFPVFSRIRTDKNINQITSKKEIIDLKNEKN